MADEVWWVQRHKLNMKDFISYVEKYLAGDYPRYLMEARLRDYQREYIEAKPE